jgi:hypothetical protein
MSSARIPSAAQLRGILVQVERLASIIRGLLEKFPAGIAPSGATTPRDVAIEALKASLDRAEAVAAFGWPDPLPDDLRTLNDLVDDLTSHRVSHIFLIGQPPWMYPPPPPDRFDVQEEGRILSRLDALATSLRSGLAALQKRGREQAAAKTPEDDFIPFAEALLITNLTASELSKASRRGGPVRSKGKGKGKKRVHELDARRLADELARRRDERRK